MRKSYVLGLLALFVTILLCSMQSCSCSRKGHGVYEVITYDGKVAEVYSGIDDEAPVVATLDSGTVVNYVSKSYNWVYIELDGDTCCVRSEQIAYNYVYDETDEEYEKHKGEVDLGLFKVKWYWLVLVLVIGFMIPEVRTVFRWALFIPIALLACLLFDLVNPVEFIAGLIFREILPYWAQIVFDVVNDGFQFCILIFVGANVCPKYRVGALATAATGLFLMIYHIFSCKQAVMLYVGAEPESLDVLHTLVMLSVFIIITLVVVFNRDLLKSDDDD